MRLTYWGCMLVLGFMGVAFLPNLMYLLMNNGCSFYMGNTRLTLLILIKQLSKRTNIAWQSLWVPIRTIAWTNTCIRPLLRSIWLADKIYTIKLGTIRASLAQASCIVINRRSTSTINGLAFSCFYIIYLTGRTFLYGWFTNLVICVPFCIDGAGLALL